MSYGDEGEMESSEEEHEDRGVNMDMRQMSRDQLGQHSQMDAGEDDSGEDYGEDSLLQSHVQANEGLEQRLE
jgi:hypothetical protein